MHNLHRYLPLLFLTALCTCALARVQAQQRVKVDVNLDVRHSVNGTDTFARDRFITMHAELDDNEWNSAEQREEFLNGYDVYLGRNNGWLPWNMDQTAEDPARPGYPSDADLSRRGEISRNNYARKTELHGLEHRYGSMMIGGQPVMFPNGRMTRPNACCSQATPWAFANYEALAEYMAGFATHYYREGGTTGTPRPLMMEVMNEPFVHAGSLGTTKLEIAKMHKVVADKMHAVLPEMLVGGYTAAFPAYEAAEFNHWRDNWKMFIDEAGAEMDFFSLHLYDITNDAGDIMYRSGSNAEAILDMIESYSMIKLGEVKPWNISEFGWFDLRDSGSPYTKAKDWGNLRSFSSFTMQLLERPDLVIKSMPFHILKANWWSHPDGYRYGSRLLRQQFELEGETGNEWVYTELLKWYQLWKDIKGVRVDTKATDPDLQTDAYVDGKDVYIILNNLEHEPVKVSLNIPELANRTPVAVTTRELHANSGDPELVTGELGPGVHGVELSREATMIVHLTFEDEIVPDAVSEERKYYADDYLKPIRRNQANVFNIDGVETGVHGEATLRLGLGRNLNLSRRPVIRINGNNVEVPEDYRGYDQASRDKFFGVIEIPVPYDLLETNNEVSISFDDNGGHISSLTLQTWAFSREIPRSDGLVSTREPQLAATAVDVFPNPASEVINVRLDADLGAAEVTIRDLQGRIVLQRSGVRNSVVLPVGELAAGAYLVRVAAAAGVTDRKVVVR